MHQNDLFASSSSQVDFDELEQQALLSTAVAKVIVAGLPIVGLIAVFFHGMSLLASLMSGAFLFGAVMICRRALVTFTGDVLRLLVAARFAIMIVVGALLVVTSGAHWTAFVSGVLAWLAADRLLGRRALHQLWKDANDQ